MPSGLGKYIEADLSSVKNSAEKTPTFLSNWLRKQQTRNRVVVFLGEEHRNLTDQAVTQGILAAPPLVHLGAMRVILERGLDLVPGYAPGVAFGAFPNVRVEAGTEGLSH